MSTESVPVANVSRSVMEGKNASYHGSISGFFPTQCSPMPQPALGLPRIIHGNGTNVGTVIALNCPDKHKLIGDSVKCVMDANSTYWVGKTYCKPLSYNEAYGFQLAVLVSIVSSGIILLMSMAFLTCCLVNCIEKSKRKEMQRDSEMLPQWEERLDQREVNRARYSNKSRNNNNNNFMEKEMTPWSQRDLGQCQNFHTCRCQQPYYDLLGPSCSYVADTRLPVLPGYEYNETQPQRPSSLYAFNQPMHVQSSRQSLNSDLVQDARRSDPLWEFGAHQSSVAGAPNQTRNINSKEFSIRVISV